MRFNLSLDDFSPHPRAGLNFESIYWCNKLIDIYPEIKIDLFVPAAYSRLGEAPCFLSEHPEWIKRVISLPDNYRICCHGYFHKRLSQKRGNSNNDEWQFLNEEQATVVFNHMVGEFQMAGLDYHKTFRPPGWKISQSAVKVLTDNNFIIAGSREYYDKISTKVSGSKWVLFNWDLVSQPPKCDTVVAYGHTSSWTNNYMNEDRFNLICDYLSKQNDVRFEFIADLGE